jgi:acetyltransferase-like isoleucine patch superfamily enzyme
MLRKIAYFVRGFIWSVILRAHGAKIGKRLRVERGLQFRGGIHGGITFEDDVTIGPHCILDAPGRLFIGAGAGLTAWNYISAIDSVSIGADTVIGERTSIRDADHGLVVCDTPMHRQKMNASPITIGGNIWIGCNCTILRGSRVGDGAVVAAGAVVRGDVKAGEIVGGVPAKTIRMR